VSFTPGPLYSGERTSGTGIHWIGDWVGPKAGLDAVAKRKIPNPRRESNPQTPISSPQPVAMGRIILKWLQNTGCVGMDSFQVAQCTVQGCVLINKVMKLQVP
jgi:hypothetical protein